MTEFEMVRFVRKTSECLSEIDQDNQECIIEKQNQRHLNIQYNRKNSYNYSSSKYIFNFTYDKTNPQLWYAKFQPCLTSDKTNPQLWYATFQPRLTSFTNKTEYFPVTTTAQESLSSKDAILTLTTDLDPAVESLLGCSLMEYLLQNIFMPDGATNLCKLEQLHQHVQQTVYCNVQESSPLYKHPLYFLFDLLATQVSLADSASSDNNQLILAYMQIIHATKDNPDLLQQAINQEGAVVNNIFNLDKIKAYLQIPSMQAGMMNAIRSNKLHTILKEYADKRIHNTAIAQQRSNVANKQYDDALAYAHFIERTFLALTIFSTILMVATVGILVVTALPYFLLPLAFFAAGAIFCGYQALQSQMASTILPKWEKIVAENSLNDSYSITQAQQSLSTDYIQRACSAFEETAHVADTQEGGDPIRTPRPTSPVNLGTSRWSMLANKPSSSSADLHDLERTSPSVV